MLEQGPGPTKPEDSDGKCRPDPQAGLGQGQGLNSNQKTDNIMLTGKQRLLQCYTTSTHILRLNIQTCAHRQCTDGCQMGAPYLLQVDCQH